MSPSRTPKTDGKRARWRKDGSSGLWKGYYVRIYVWDADSWKIRVEYVIFGRH